MIQALWRLCPELIPVDLVLVELIQRPCPVLRYTSLRSRRYIRTGYLGGMADLQVPNGITWGATLHHLWYALVVVGILASRQEDVDRDVEFDG